VLDRRSDIFSLGVVLYLATVGSHPFRRAGEARHQQIARLLSSRVKLPSELVKGYPKELEVIVMRALSRNPAQRYGTAGEMARRLQDWVVATGPLVTEQQIAQLVLTRAGPAILERSERIANLLWTPSEAPPSGDDVVPSPADPTLVPTTSRSGSVSPERARARATLRVVSTTLTAAALGLAASVVFSTPLELTPGALPAPAVFAASTPPGAEPAPLPSWAPSARDAPAATSAPELPASVRPAEISPAPGASSLPERAAPTLAEPAPPLAARAATKPAASAKARKPSRPKRKRPARIDDSLSIKSGR
jgi:eukaryotic-like serine/threonine-protein kinase